METHREVGNRSSEIISAQNYELFGYFESISSVISAFFGDLSDSKIMDPVSLLAQCSSIIKDALLAATGSGTGSCTTNCRNLAFKHLFVRSCSSSLCIRLPRIPWLPGGLAIVYICFMLMQLKYTTGAMSYGFCSISLSKNFLSIQGKEHTPWTNKR